MFIVHIYTKDRVFRKLLELSFLQFSRKFEIKSFFFDCEERIFKNHLNPTDLELKPHLLVIDLDLNENFNAIQLAQTIRNYHFNPNLEFIIVSDNIEKLISGMQLRPLKALNKNLNSQAFITELHSIFEHSIFFNDYFIPIKFKDKYMVLHTNEILAITKEKEILSQKKIVFHTQKESYLTNGNLSDFAKNLRFPFFLIHRSIIINLRFVSYFDSKTVTLSNDATFPISRSKRIYLKKLYSNDFSLNI
ncbi:LytTR family DNA-binding domain-containing protein [Paenibacillus hunanensis]|uniref:LytR/AlgR family response regulator transcription factor n=1 Tax=Paenibacillus hunanensis TaxID=539262 RepID=UPI002A69E8F2|nr:LytTR family DNA-binding domain-containing protein [Paenibacillus hunanensis]WPP41130.1 LytTR family DNA-binding domain-containing protein [Paenibacillus hunanensis]